MKNKFKTIQELLKTEFHYQRLLPNLTTGVLIGFTEVIFAVSLSNLLFSGDLSPYFPLGAGIAVASLAITTIIITLTSSVPGVAIGIQESPAVIQGIIITSIYTAMNLQNQEGAFTTVLAVIAITSLLTGIFFFILGFFKLGGLVRYIPYPVVGGFLAGTGLLMVQASTSVMTDIPLGIAGLPNYLSHELLILWLPGTLLALVLFICQKKVKHFLTLPVVIIGSMILFYLGLSLTGTSIVDAIQNRFLIHGLSDKAIWKPYYIAGLATVDWGMIFKQSGNIATIFIISVLNLLFNATGLELITRRDIDINHELKASGLANIFSGFAGGMIGYQTMSETSLSYHLKAKGRFPGLIAAFMPLIILIAGGSSLVYFPRFILGGLLLFLGIEFLYEWLIQGWKRLSRIDYTIVVLILLVIGTIGFLAGIGIGLFATLILFVVNYSQIEIVQYSLSGKDRRSNFERPNQHWDLLNEYGEYIQILELQGFIFFGTASRLINWIKLRIEDQNHLPIHKLIIDFRRVSGLDSSAVFSFQKCTQLAESHNIEIVMTDLSDSVKENFIRGRLFDGNDKIKLFPDLDHGLEYSENQILKSLPITDIQIPDSIWDKLVYQGFPKQMIRPLKKHLEYVQIEAGEYLIRQGDNADELYFIESGTLSIFLESRGEKRTRLQTLSERIIVGELGLYIDLKRTASIIADQDCTAYRLSKQAMEEIQKEELDLAAAIHEFVACLLARLLADSTRFIAALDQ